jgi:hypothetical protein
MEETGSRSVYVNHFNHDVEPVTKAGNEQRLCFALIIKEFQFQAFAQIKSSPSSPRSIPFV